MLTPVQTMVLVITVRSFSVEFEPTGEFRDILHETDSGTDSATVPPDVSPRPPFVVRLTQLFKDINQRRSLEGYALQAGIVVMAMFLVWISGVSLLRAVFPEFDANRSGPKGFPVSLHIGESSFAFTNGSDVSWTCRAELGRERLAAAFQLNAGITTQIDFARFDRSGMLDGSRIRSAAQDRIWLVCDQPSGISHSANLR